MQNRILAFISSIIMAIGLVSFLSISARADNHTVVRDSNGGVVRDSSGNCVRTQWEGSTDECVTRTTVSREAVEIIMAMDERIIYFDFDKSDIKNSEKDKLNTLAEALRTHNIKAIKVIGYTDKIGSSKYNDALSKKRANSVKRFLDSKVKLDSSVVHLRGFGKENQVKECDGVHNRKELIECLAPNRRVEIEVDYYDNVK